MSGIGDTLKKPILFKEPEKSEGFILKEEDEGRGEERPKTKDGANRKKPLPEISKSLSENLDYIKSIYSIPENGDIILREFDVVFNNRTVNAFIVFFDGMTDRKIINEFILQPLMILSSIDAGDTGSHSRSMAEHVKKRLLPQNQLKLCKTYNDIIDEVNFGGCGIFIDGLDTAFTADVKGWEHRGVERPNTELVIRGPQEGFTEVLRVNTALIRKILKDEDLIAENLAVGKRSKTPCALMYIKDIANESLVEEVRKRLKGIETDNVTDSGELEQFLEDSTFLPAPQILATERPDRAASLLADGKVAVVMHGSPFVLVMPSTLAALVHTTEDANLRFPYGNFLRIIRYIAIFIALVLPGAYIAITNYHHEMIPTDLLFSIESAREKVPFPSVLEILIMEIAFELIREAGIRIPGPIGPTLGIIGALILGQAAVAANIVSPVLIIIVAVTGIGSFAVPNFSLALAFRMLRFAFIALGAMAGFLGITLGLFLYGMVLVSSKSFGVPFLAPFGPKTFGGLDTLARAPVWMQESRPDFLNTKSRKKQPHISKKWSKQGKREDES